MQTFRSGILTLTACGLLLVCLGGVSGCDSRPSDGSMIEPVDGVSAEQKAKVKGFYANRAKAATKKAGRSR